MTTENTPTILFVDDETFILDTLRRIFSAEGYDLLLASSGDEALDFLERTPVQVVVSDFRMPGMNGGELLRAVADRWPDTIRIILSGFADMNSVITAINEGQIYKFISKPWRNEELKAVVRAAAEKHRQLTDLRAVAETTLAQNEALLATHLDGVNNLNQRNLVLEERVEQLEIYRQAFQRMSVPALLFHDGRCTEINDRALPLVTEPLCGDAAAEHHPLIAALVQALAALDEQAPQAVQISLDNQPTLKAEIIPLPETLSPPGVLVLLHES